MAEVKMRLNLDAEEVELVVDGQVALASGPDVFKNWVDAYAEKQVPPTDYKALYEEAQAKLDAKPEPVVVPEPVTPPLPETPEPVVEPEVVKEVEPAA